MDYSKFIIFSDLDGTLLTDDKNVCQANKDAIKMFTDNGGTFAVSTGRNEKNINNFIDTNCINGPSILYNGTVVYDCIHQKMILEKRFNYETFEELFDYVKKKYPNADINLYNEGYADYLTEIHHQFAYELHKPCRMTTVEYAKENPFLKVLICSYPDEIDELHQYVKDTGFLNKVDAVRSDRYYLEFLPKGYNKGTMIRKVKEMEQYKDKIVIGVGDYNNDYEMLKAVDVPICPSNALDNIKAICEYIVCDNNTGCIADIIKNILPKL